MRFLTRPQVAPRLEGKTVAIVGSGPSVLTNAPGYIDSHDVVVRVNNFKLSDAAGHRADVFYSFFGTSIRKSAKELRNSGVTLCLCKCPDATIIDSEWHRKHNKIDGIDFRRIYRRRSAFWFCETYIPTLDEFMAKFHLLGGHIPTTGFAAILDVLSFNPRSVYLTGFDFFRSGLHNVDEKWRSKNPDDPIGHVPEHELAWLAASAPLLPITFDDEMERLVCAQKAA